MATHTFKQLGGALVGMGVAALIYVALSWSSFVNIKGYLIESLGTSNPGQVRVNSTVVDDRTLAHIATRAQEVAKGMQASESSIANVAASSVGQIEYRREQRIADAPHASAGENIIAGVPLYERVQIREESRREHIQTVEVAPSEASASVRVVKTKLPDSGPGLILLGTASLLGAALGLRKPKASRA